MLISIFATKHCKTQSYAEELYRPVNYSEHDCKVQCVVPIHAHYVVQASIRGRQHFRSQLRRMLVHHDTLPEHLPHVTALDLVKLAGHKH